MLPSTRMARRLPFRGKRKAQAYVALRSALGRRRKNAAPSVILARIRCVGIMTSVQPLRQSRLKAPMILVHYLDNSRAHRILWLLEELELDYEVKTYRRGSDMRAPDSLRQVHPLGKSPVLEDGGKVYAESGAIIEYLLDTYGNGRLRPVAGTDAYRRYLYWLHYAEGSAMPLLLLKLLFTRLPGQMPWLLRPVAAAMSKGVRAKLIDPQLRDHLVYWETELKREGFFAGGDLTGADIAMSFPVEAAMSRADAAGDTPAIRAFLEAIRKRPAYRKALEKGGAYVYARS